MAWHERRPTVGRYGDSSLSNAFSSCSIKWGSFPWQIDQEPVQKLSVKTMTGSGVAAPSEVYGQNPFWEVWGWSSQKLNTFTYRRVNFACIFAHKRYEYADKLVGLLHLQTFSSLSPLYLPMSKTWLRMVSHCLQFLSSLLQYLL